MKTLLPALIVLAVDFCGVIAAILADLIAGIAKARRDRRKLTSSGFRRTVDKLSRYCLAMFGLAVVDAVIIAAVVCLNIQRPEGSFPVLPIFTSLGALGLTLIEVKSIFERTDEKGDMGRATRTIGHLLRDLVRNPDDLDSIKTLIRLLK